MIVYVCNSTLYHAIKHGCDVTTYFLVLLYKHAYITIIIHTRVYISLYKHGRPSFISYNKYVIIVIYVNYLIKLILITYTTTATLNSEKNIIETLCVD